MKKLTTLFLFILFLFPTISFGTDYYVSSSDGNNSDSGLTEELAWETLAKVSTEVDAGTFGAGDSVKFKRGDTWSGTLYLDKSGGFGGAGTHDNDLVFEDYGSGNLPQINFSSYGISITNGAHDITVKNLKLVGPGNSTSYAVELHWASYLTFDGLYITECLEGIEGSNGGYVPGDITEYITIQNCTFDTVYRESTYFKVWNARTSTSRTSYISILNNTFFNGAEALDVKQQTYPSGDPGSSYGPDHITFRGNLIYNMDYSISAGNVAVVTVYYDGGDFIFEDNIIHDCIPEPSYGGVVQLSHNYGSTGTAYIRNNVIYDVTGAPFVWCFTVAGTVEVYYNTFHNGNEQGFHFSSTPSGITIKNNIFSEVDGDPIDSSSPTSDYNVRYNCGSCSDPGANDQTGDPRFVSVAQGSEDFHLLDTASSAYNTGVDVGITDDIEGIARPQGLAYDIGAYEYAASFEEILSSLGISVLSVQDLQFYIYVLLTTAILTSIIRDLQGYVDSLLSTGISVSAITDSVSGGSSGESGVYGGTIYGGAIN